MSSNTLQVAAAAPASRRAEPTDADFLLPALERMPRAELERHQEAQLAAMLAHAYERAPLIRQAWQRVGLTPSDIRSLEDFKAKAPFITKDSVREYRDQTGDQRGGLTTAPIGELKAMGTSSGTSGDPTPIPWGTRTPPEIGYARDLWGMGARPGDFVANIMFTFKYGHRARVMQEVGFKPIFFSVAPSEVPLFCEASRRFRPTAINMLTTPLLMGIEEHFEKSGEDPLDVFSSYKGAIFGGEPLGPRIKSQLNAWGLEIFETTSLGDVCGATECWAHDGAHGWEDLALIECLDPVTDEPVVDGAPGEMVVTSLTNRFIPLIRYKTDDLVTVDRSPCRCGRTHLRYKVLGRKGDQIVVEGRSILPRDVLSVVEAHSETRAGLFQIIRPAREMDELALRVGYDTGRLTGALDALAGSLRQHMQEHLGVPVRIELTPKEELLKLGPPHKIPRVTRQ